VDAHNINQNVGLSYSHRDKGIQQIRMRSGIDAARLNPQSEMQDVQEEQ